MSSLVKDVYERISAIEELLKSFPYSMTVHGCAPHSAKCSFTLADALFSLGIIARELRAGQGSRSTDFSLEKKDTCKICQLTSA